MTKIPKVTKAIRDNHAKESGVIVEGKFVAFGKNSYEAAEKAEKLGYPPEEIMTVFITGEEYYVV